jgi:hypothetical protein
MRIYPSPVGVVDEKPRLAWRKLRRVGNVFAFAKFQQRVNFLQWNTIVGDIASVVVCFALKATEREP